MSIGFICGAVPSSLTVPLILPSAAALTFCVEYNRPYASNNSAETVIPNLYPAFISFSLNVGQVSQPDHRLTAVELGPPALRLD